MATRTLSVVITGDPSGAQKAMGTVTDGATTMADKFKSAGKSMMSAGAKMSIGITAPLALLGKASFDAASDLNESISKVGVVFEDMAPKVIKWSEDAATAMGMSQQAALEAAGTFGNFFQAMGVYQGPATEMSLKLVQLAADLASFNNASPDDVLLALRAGLAGEAEPLRKFGVSLSAARVEAEALASGLVQPVASMADITEASIKVEKANAAAQKALEKYGAESLEYRDAATKVTAAEDAFTKVSQGKTTELTAAQKAQAAYSIIMKDTAMAQGDFARTADGAANKQRILAAQMKDMEAQLGKALIPIFQKVAGVLQEVAQWFTHLSPEVQQYIVYAGMALAVMGPLTTAVGALATAFGLLLSPVTLVVLAIAAVGAAAYLLWTNWDTVWNWIKDHPAIAIVISILAAPVAAFVLIIGALHTLYENWDTIWNSIKDVIGPVVAVITAAIQPIIDVIEGVIGGIRDMKEELSGIGSFVTGSSGDINDLDAEHRALFKRLGYADGGWVPGTGNTDSVPAMLTPGEFVVSKDMMRNGALGGGDTYNIYTTEPRRVPIEIARQQRARQQLANL